MEAIFLTLLEVSAASAVVILIVVLLSSIINRSYTARWKYWLWMVLAARLLIPFNLSFETAPARVEVSIPAASISLPAAATAPAQPAQPVSPPPAVGQLSLPDTPDLPITPAAPAAPAITVMELLMLVWLAGVVLFLLWQAASYLRFRGQVRRWGLPVRRDSIIAYVRRQTEAEFGIGKSVPTLICKKVSSPMMIGFFRPLLILPHDRYSAADLSFILRHELTHCKRRDIWYKSLLLLANAVHWFNPAVWLMVREASRDLEISCDAAVMKNAGLEERRQYSETILACVHRELAMKTALSTHFYGGKKALKERFANILSTRKRRGGLLTFAAVLLCGALIGGLVVCNAAAPPEDPAPDPSEGPSPDRRELTDDEIAQINAAFDPETGSNVRPGPLSAYFITNYETPYDLTLSEFLVGFPIDDVVTEPAELEALKTRDYWPFRHDVNLDTAPALPGLLRRIPAADVEAKLREGFGIGLEDLTYTPNWNLMYLEEYDCFYRIANEVLFGYFTCTRGYLEGDTAVLLDENESRRLELRRSGDRWLFYSLTGRELHDDMQYYDPLSIYGTAAQGQDDSEVAPSQMAMPTQTDWAAEAQVQRYQAFLDVLEPVQVGSFLIFLSPDDRSRRVDLTWEQSMWFLDQLKMVRLAPAQPTEPGTEDAGDTVSLHIISLGEQWTIRHNGDRLYFGRYRDNTIWIFDGESCAEIFQTMREAAEALIDSSELFDPPPTDPAWTLATPENSSQVVPLYFSLGRQGEVQALRAGDTIGDWQLESYTARWEEENDGIPWVNGAHFSTRTPVEINCTVSLTPYNTDMRLYWFQVSEEDEDKLPVLSGSTTDVWFQVSDDPVMAPLRDLAPGEQRSCRVALHSYVYYAMPMESRNIGSVSWLVTEDGGQETRTAAFNADVVNFDGNSVGSYYEFAVQMPASWTVSNGGIYDDEGLLTAETLPWIWTSGIDDDTAFARLYERYPDAEPIDVTIGDLAGKRYRLDNMMTEGPFVGAYDPELYYYLKSYDLLVGIKFYPKRGIGGILNQREDFESSIRLVF